MSKRLHRVICYMISFFCVKFSYKKSDAISLFSIQRSYSSSEIFCANGSVNCSEKGDEVDKNTRKKYRGLKNTWDIYTGNQAQQIYFLFQRSYSLFETNGADRKISIKKFKEEPRLQWKKQWSERKLPERIQRVIRYTIFLSYMRYMQGIKHNEEVVWKNINDDTIYNLILIC